MTGYVGHHTVRATLERELPPVALLTGPASVGKWTLTQYLADHHGVAPVDRAAYPDGFTADAARGVRDFVVVAPFGAFKLVAARLTNTSDAAYNVLLKTLEEPPVTARFLLTYDLTVTGRGAPRLPATVRSRCHTFTCGLLTTDEIAEILVSQGMSPAAAARAAPHGRGRVAPARSLGGADAAKTAVLTIVKAIATGDRELYDKSFAGFDEAAHKLLVQWCVEAITGQWSMFTTADAHGLDRHPAQVQAMLSQVSRFTYATPRLGVRAALEPFLNPGSAPR